MFCAHLRARILTKIDLVGNTYLMNLSFKFHKDLCINVCCKLYLDPFLRHFGRYLGTCFSKPIHEFKLWTQFIWSLKINEYIIFLLKLEGLSKRKIFPGTILLLTASCIFLVKAFTLQSCNIKNVYKSFLLSCCVALFFFHLLYCTDWALNMPVHFFRKGDIRICS